MNIKHKEIARIQHGTKNVMGTDWPIESFAIRCQEGKKVYWLVTYNLCNGIPSSSRRFSTRREALQALDA